MAISNGFLAGCWVANDLCSAGCQSWVSTTCLKLRASRLISGTTSSPPGTASLPPGQKSFCTSMTRRTSVSFHMASPHFGNGRGTALERRKPVDNHIDRDRPHDVGEPPLLLEDGPERAALQPLHDRGRDAARQIDPAPCQHGHRRVPGDAGEPGDELVERPDRRGVG